MIGASGCRSVQRAANRRADAAKAAKAATQATAEPTTQAAT